jgi:hypothetical protein
MPPKSKPSEAALQAAAGKLLKLEVSPAVYVIKASNTPEHKRRTWGKLQYAQATIAVLSPLGIPKHVNEHELCDKVNERLSRDPDYGYGKLSRMTVRRALQKLRDANR